MPEYYQTDAFRAKHEEAAKHGTPITSVFIRKIHGAWLRERLTHYGRKYKSWPVGDARIITTEEGCPCCGNEVGELLLIANLDGALRGRERGMRDAFNLISAIDPHGAATKALAQAIIGK